MQSMLRNHPPTLTGSRRPVACILGDGQRGQRYPQQTIALPMVTGRQPPVKATCFAGGYALDLDTSWLRVSQGQIDDPLT